MTDVKGLRRRRKSERRRGTWGLVVAQWRDLLPFIAVGFTMIVFTLVGGAPLSVLGVLALATSTATLLAAFAFSPNAARLAALPWQSRAALSAIIILPLVQLIPLPPALWQVLPGQDIRHTVLATIGRGDSWQPISLTPMFTMEAAVACLAFVVLVLVMLTLDERQLRHIGWLILAIVAIDVAVGTLQVASGGYPVLRDSRNQGAMLGFFANKNHMGLFVAASMPLAWLLLDVRRRRGPRFYLFMGWCILSLVALVATNSRSGLLVGLVAAGALSLRILFKQSLRLRITFLIGVVTAIVMVSLTNPFGALFGRFSEVDSDLRWQFWQQSIPLFISYWQFGAGAGSFSQIFLVNEQLSWLKPTYVNAVHNDYLQLVIEFGLPGVTAALLMILSIFQSARFKVKNADKGLIESGVRVGVIIVILFALQSVVDYPLRRVATLPMFAMAIALILRAALHRRPDPMAFGSVRTKT
ncbi:O-antigen ligase family protein [Sphingomonas cynarae]